MPRRRARGIISTIRPHARNVADSENRLSAPLQHREKAGTIQFQIEGKDPYDAFRTELLSEAKKRHILQIHEEELEHTGSILKAALHAKDQVEYFEQLGRMKKPDEQKILKRVLSRFRFALANAKKCLRNLLQEDWIVQAMLASIVGGVTTLGAYYLFTSATETVTELVKQAALLTSSVRAVTQLIYVSSVEASLWVAGLIGGAMGVSAGLLLSTIFPHVTGIVLAAGAAGAYSGFTLLDWRERGIVSEIIELPQPL